jgi:hypothetical protein
VVSASDSGAAAVASRAPRGEGCAMTHAGRAGNHRHPVSAASLALAGIECDMSCRSSGFTRTGGVKQQVRQEPSACVTGRLRTWVAACHCRVRRNRPSLDTLRSSASAKRPPRNSSKQPRDDDHRSRLKDWRTSCLGGRSFQNPNRCWRLVPRRTASMFAVTVCSASGRLYETLHRPTIFTGKDRGGGATGVSSNRPPLRQWLWETGDQFNARSLRAAGTDVQGGRNAETAGRYRCGRQGRLWEKLCGRDNEHGDRARYSDGFHRIRHCALPVLAPRGCVGCSCPEAQHMASHHPWTAGPIRVLRFSSAASQKAQNPA